MTKNGTALFWMFALLVFPGTALAGNWGEAWGTMAWGLVVSVPSVPVIGLIALAIALSATAAWLLRKRRAAFGLPVLLVLLAIPLVVVAGTVSVPNTFVNGAVADADEVNTNFDAIETAVNDNDSRITDESTARTAADGVHDTDIQTNATAIAGETTARAAADAAQDTAIATNATAIAGETTARTAADGALDTRLGVVESGTLSGGLLSITPGGNVGVGNIVAEDRLHVDRITNSDDYTTAILLENVDQRLRIGAYYESGIGQHATIDSTRDGGATQPIKLILNPSGGQVGVGKVPSNSLDVEGGATINGDFNSTGTATATGGFESGIGTIPADIWSPSAIWLQGAEGSLGTQGNYGVGLYQNGYRGAGATFTLMGVGPSDESWNQEEMNGLELDRSGFSFLSTDYGSTGGFPRTGLAKPEIRMRIAPNGNVGIGGVYTSNGSVQPGSRLEVVGGDITVDGDIIFGPSNTSLTAALASAGVGVAEINQDCAVNTGCFSGDVAGLPVTITAPGSYRLTSNLLVPDENTNGIEVGASDVTIDLNTFSIIGASCLGASSSACTPASGTGDGITCASGSTGLPLFWNCAGEDGISVKNGSIVGMGLRAVFLGSQASVVNLQARWNRDGIWTGTNSTVSDSTSLENGMSGGTGEFINLDLGVGIHSGSNSTISGNKVFGNGSNGISTFIGSVVSNNTASANGSAGAGMGIYAFDGSAVSYNTVWGNAGVGIGVNGAYRGNMISGNAGGTVTGALGLVVNAGGNVCDGSTTCP